MKPILPSRVAAAKAGSDRHPILVGIPLFILFKLWVLAAFLLFRLALEVLPRLVAWLFGLALTEASANEGPESPPGLLVN